MARRFAYYWLPLLLWIAVITAFSTDTFSAQNTGSVIEKVITLIVGHPLPPETFDPMHFVIRKLAHLSEYAVLGLLAFRAVRGDERGWNMRWTLLAIGIAAAVAISDEFHQTFVPSRTPSPVDVMIDVTGAAIAQTVFIFRRRVAPGV